MFCLVAPPPAGLSGGARLYPARKRMEIRFFAPGSLVSNLDFVESIFGNAGDPGPARKTTPAWTSSIGPATPAASSSRRT